VEHSVSWPVGVAVAGGLVTAVGALWKIVFTGMQETRRQLQHCEEQHGKQSERVEELGVKFSYLEGRMQERNETVDKLQGLEQGVEGLTAAVNRLSSRGCVEMEVNDGAAD